MKLKGEIVDRLRVSFLRRGVDDRAWSDGYTEGPTTTPPLLYLGLKEVYRRTRRLAEDVCMGILGRLSTWTLSLKVRKQIASFPSRV